MAVSDAIERDVLSLAPETAPGNGLPDFRTAFGIIKDKHEETRGKNALLQNEMLRSLLTEALDDSHLGMVGRFFQRRALARLFPEDRMAMLRRELAKPI